MFWFTAFSCVSLRFPVFLTVFLLYLTLSNITVNWQCQIDSADFRPNRKKKGTSCQLRRREKANYASRGLWLLKKNKLSRAKWFLPLKKKASPSLPHPGPRQERCPHSRGPLCPRLYFVVALSLLNSCTHCHNIEKINIHFFLRQRHTFVCFFSSFLFLCDKQ